GLGGEGAGNEVRGRGRGHGGKDRSLSVKLDAGAADGFLVHSFSNDDAIACRDYVREKTGMAAFKPNGHGNGRSHRASAAAISAALASAMESIEREQPKGRIVETYDYTDEEGALLYQNVRYEPKDFRQRRPDGKGGWTWSLNGCRRVPYRMPELHEFAGAPIVLTEGEKDSDKGASLGMLCTTVGRDNMT